MSIIKSLLSSFLKRDTSKPAARSSRSAAITEEAEFESKTGRVVEAEALFAEAIALDPLNIIARNDYGSLLMHTHRLEEAARQFQTILSIDDQFAPALVNLSHIYLDTFRSREAEELLKGAGEIVGRSPYIDFGLGRTKLFRGDPTAAVGYYLSAWLKNLDDRNFSQGYLWSICYSELATAENIAAQHGFWAETLPPAAPCTRTPREHSNNRIRIGYLSPDFREHSVRYFILPLLRHHDKSRFEVYAYSDSSHKDLHTDAVENVVDFWRNIGHKPDDEVAAIIARDDLDILVELAGHTSGNRVGLLNGRLARVQMSAIGYPPTTGLSSIDYKVVDAIAAPIGTEHYYAEELLRLPETFWCFDPGEPHTPLTPPPRLTKGHVTFGCYGNIAKISPKILDCWREILAQVYNAQLIVRGITFQDEEALQTIQQRMKEHGIDVDRVHLLPPTKPEHFAAAYAEIDIVLDTFPFNGGTTTCHALWNGVPIVTLAGEILLSRMGASMLNNVGLTDLIAETSSEYITRAIALAGQDERLDQLRRTLRDRMSNCALGNGRIYTAHFEAACQTAINKYNSRSSSSDTNRKPLPAISENDAAERTEAIYRAGHQAAAPRVLSYLQKHYPDNLTGKILASWEQESKGQYSVAREILLGASTSPFANQAADLAVNLVRIESKLGLYDEIERRARLALATHLPTSHRLALSTYLAVAQARQPHCLKEHIPSSIKPRHEQISIIICSIDDVRFERTRTSFSRALAGRPHEIIRINDASSLAEGYNRAFVRSNGDLLIFCHDDVEILSSNFCLELDLAMAHCDIVGVVGATKVTGPAWWHAGSDYARGAVVMPSTEIDGHFVLLVYGGIDTPLSTDITGIDGLFFAVKRKVFNQVRFDEITFDGFHLYDLDFTLSAYRAGFRLGVAPRLALLHHSTGAYNKDWLTYAKRFSEKHNLPWDKQFTLSGWGTTGVELLNPGEASHIIDILFVEKQTQAEHNNPLK